MANVVVPNLKGPFPDPSIILLIMTFTSVYDQNKLISNFSVDSEVAFVSYSCFTDQTATTFFYEHVKLTHTISQNIRLILKKKKKKN